MKNLLFQFLSISEQTFTPVEAHRMLGKHAHGLYHLCVRAEIKKETTLGVDEVDLHVIRDQSEPRF